MSGIMFTRHSELASCQSWTRKISASKLSCGKKEVQSHFHFRPYKLETDKKCLPLQDESSESSYSQTLLYVHQEPWQQQLLKRYGNIISFMDATYKTTKYELALFFIAVKTNVGYSVVGEFVVQSETTEQVAEALSIL